MNTCIECKKQTAGLCKECFEKQDKPYFLPIYKNGERVDSLLVYEVVERKLKINQW